MGPHAHMVTGEVKQTGIERPGSEVIEPINVEVIAEIIDDVPGTIVEHGVPRALVALPKFLKDLYAISCAKREIQATVAMQRQKAALAGKAIDRFGALEHERINAISAAEAGSQAVELNRVLNERRALEFDADVELEKIRAYERVQVESIQAASSTAIELERLRTDAVITELQERYDYEEMALDRYFRDRAETRREEARRFDELLARWDEDHAEKKRLLDEHRAVCSYYRKRMLKGNRSASAKYTEMMKILVMLQDDAGTMPPFAT